MVFLRHSVCVCHDLSSFVRRFRSSWQRSFDNLTTAMFRCICFLFFSLHGYCRALRFCFGFCLFPLILISFLSSIRKFVIGVISRMNFISPGRFFHNSVIWNQTYYFFGYYMNLASLLIESLFACPEANRDLGRQNWTNLRASSFGREQAPKSAPHR